MTPELNIPNYIQILFGKIHHLEEEVLVLKEHLHRKPAKGSPNKEEEKQLFTVQGAAQFLSVSTNTIYILKAEDKIPYMQKGRRIYFSRESLLMWLQDSCKNSQPQELTNQQVVQRYLKPRRKKLGS